MSYILDALRKSEEKRGAMSAPSVKSAVVPVHPSGHRRFMWPVLFSMLALTVGWLVARWQVSDVNYGMNQSIMDDTMSQPSARVVESENFKFGEVGGVEEPLVVRRPQISSVIPAQVENSTPTPIQTEKSVVKSVNSAFPVSEIKTLHPQATELQAGTVSPSIKSMLELPQKEQQSMPVIHIEGHIYDVDPQARMVIINGKVRKEKQSIGAGLILQEVTPDGVILQYHGHVFHMGVFDQ